MEEITTVQYSQAAFRNPEMSGSALFETKYSQACDGIKRGYSQPLPFNRIGIDKLVLSKIKATRIKNLDSLLSQSNVKHKIDTEYRGMLSFRIGTMPNN